MEGGEELGFALCNGVAGGAGLVGEGGGSGVDGVNVVPDGGWAHPSKGSEYPWEEDAVTGGGAGGVLGGFLFGAGGDDGEGVMDGGGEDEGRRGQL